MNNNIKWITRTAILLALCVLFQMIKLLMPAAPTLVTQLIIGSLVNLTLIIAVLYVGFWSGAAIAVFSTIIAFTLGQMPVPQLVPVVALGNLAIVAVVWLFSQKNNLNGKITGIVLGAVVKFLFLWFAVSQFVVQFAPNTKIVKALVLSFSWPQLITALIGGALALIIASRIKNIAKH